MKTLNQKSSLNTPTYVFGIYNTCCELKGHKCNSYFPLSCFYHRFHFFLLKCRFWVLFLFLHKVNVWVFHWLTSWFSEGLTLILLPSLKWVMYNKSQWNKIKYQGFLKKIAKSEKCEEDKDFEEYYSIWGGRYE